MFANYPLFIQIIAWAIFMALNGYIAASCPFLNLSILALVGLFYSTRTGVVLLAVSVLFTLCQTAYAVLIIYALGYAGGEDSSFWEQGLNRINLVLAVIILIILMKKFLPSLLSAKWVIGFFMVLLYGVGMWLGLKFWFPVFTHGIVLVASGLLLSLCYTSTAPVGLAICILALVIPTAHKTIKVLRRASFLQAVSSSRPEKVLQLLNKVEGKTQQTALAQSCAAGNKKMLELLLKENVDAGGLMSNNIKNLDYSGVKMLVDVGYQPDTEDLNRAIQYNFFPAVKLFVEHGVKEGSPYLDHPLQVALYKGHMDIAEYLFRKGFASRSDLDEMLFKDFHNPSDKLLKEIIGFLLLHGANINAKRGDKQQSFLSDQAGAPTENPQKIELLLENGAEVEDEDLDGNTPLVAAIRGTNKRNVEVLLKYGADINHANKEGKTPLMWTATTADVVLLEFLLENGADINAQDNQGDTILLIALRCARLNPKFYEVLLKYGADVNIANKKGETALILASQSASLKRLFELKNPTPENESKRQTRRAKHTY